MYLSVENANFLALSMFVGVLAIFFISKGRWLEELIQSVRTSGEGRGDPTVVTGKDALIQIFARGGFWFVAACCWAATIYFLSKGLKIVVPPSVSTAHSNFPTQLFTLVAIALTFITGFALKIARDSYTDIQKIRDENRKELLGFKTNIEKELYKDRLEQIRLNRYNQTMLEIISAERLQNNFKSIPEKADEYGKKILLLSPLETFYTGAQGNQLPTALEDLYDATYNRSLKREDAIYLQSLVDYYSKYEHNSKVVDKARKILEHVGFKM